MLILMPHHVIDIVRADMSRWAIPPKSPLGHRVREVCIRLFADRDAMIEVVDGADEICAGCAMFVDGRCINTIDTDFRPGAPAGMYDYNRLIDARWRERLALATGDRLTARAFVERLAERAGDIATIYPETPAATMVQWDRAIRQGIANYLDERRTPPAA